MKKFIALIFSLLLVTLAFAAGQPAEPAEAAGSAVPVWDFLASNWAELLMGLLAFVKVVVRLTPTVKDDAVFGKIDSLIGWFIPNITKKSGKT